LTKEELQKENEALKSKLEALNIENEDLKKSLQEHKNDIQALESCKNMHENNKAKLDSLISEKIKEFEEAAVVNSIMMGSLESLCKARNLLGGE